MPDDPLRPLVLLPRPRAITPLRGRAAVNAEPRIASRIDPDAMPHAQGYELRIDGEGIRITAHDEAGQFYARRTLAQLAANVAEADALPAVLIRDWPDFAQRGVMLDISRDKVPTMATFARIIDLLASWKINHLQLYTEHTFAYRGHEEVWREASPLTPDEVRQIDAWCRERHVQLVPNQNSFGHMHRWLKHDRYRPLAELPEGWAHPFSDNVSEPFSLCPTDPASVDLIRDLYDQLLPCFTSALFNIGGDETWDLGKGRSNQACDQRGVGRVYLDFLLKLQHEVTRRGKRMLFWGDIILNHPELIEELPRDAVPLAWGYEADHPFGEQAHHFAAAGLDFYVCPGTSSWNSLLGRTDNAIGNLRSAAANGIAHGASGYLITDWGDGGHWQPLPVSYLGYACGAAASWCDEANRDIDLPAALSRFAFGDTTDTVGRIVYDMGNLYRQCGRQIGNASLPAMMLRHWRRPGEHEMFEGLDAEALDDAAARCDRLLADLSSVRMTTREESTLRDEFEAAGRLFILGCQLGAARVRSDAADVSSLPAGTRGQLLTALRDLVPAFRVAWLARNRIGGLVDSEARLQRLEAALIAR